MRTIWLLILSLIVMANTAFAQEKPREDRSVQYDEWVNYEPKGDENGFAWRAKFSFRFINCFGEIHLCATVWAKETTTQYYRYNGKNYWRSELKDVWPADPPNLYLPLVKVEVRSGRNCMGWVQITNLIDFEIGGCIGQTYYLEENTMKGDYCTGYTNDDYLKVYRDMTIGNIIIDKPRATSAVLEMAIDALEKKNTYDQYIAEADRLLVAQEYDRAITYYNGAHKLRNDEYSARKIKEIRAIIEKKDRDAKYIAALKEGDRLLQEGKKAQARQQYKTCLSLAPNDPTATARLAKIGGDPAAEYIEAILKAINGNCSYRVTISKYDYRHYRTNNWSYNGSEIHYETNNNKEEIGGNRDYSKRMKTCTFRPDNIKEIEVAKCSYAPNLYVISMKLACNTEYCPAVSEKNSYSRDGNLSNDGFENKPIDDNFSNFVFYFQTNDIEGLMANFRKCIALAGGNSNMVNWANTLLATWCDD